MQPCGPLHADIHIYANTGQEDKALLTPEVLTLVRDLVRAEKAFEPNLAGLMALRKQKQEEIYANILAKRAPLTFPPETKYVLSALHACLWLHVAGWWHIAPTPSPPNERPDPQPHSQPSTHHRAIREGAWRSETLRPANMADRACENTHPSRAANMAIHGLNSRAASDFMDNEDSQAPLKANVLAGYRTIYGACVHAALRVVVGDG